MILFYLVKNLAKFTKFATAESTEILSFFCCGETRWWNRRRHYGGSKKEEIVMATNERFVVTGDHALRISNASAELSRQLFLQRDCKLDPERVIATLQGMTEGKLTPFAGSLHGRFIRTMSIQIGGVPKGELIEQVKTVREVSSCPESMTQHKLFTTLAESEQCILTDLSPVDLGFTENPTTTELLDPKRLLEWSTANLDGYVIELCPAEVGPHLAIQYTDQPKGEVLWVAMERILDPVGHPSVFGVERSDSGGLWLDGDWVYPGHCWPLGHRLVFRLRKVS